MKKDQAKKLTRNFGFFQQHIKQMTLEEAKSVKNEPMHHVVGNHSRCGDWCLGKRALRENKPYNKPPMFDVNNPVDQKTFVEVMKIHDNRLI